MDNEPQRMYTPEELANILQLSKSTVYRLTRKENWPHAVFGIQIRYTPEHVKQIQETHNQTPAPEPTTRRRQPRIPRRTP